MAGLYSNENFPLPVVERLRALGHDVLTLQEAGKADQALPDQPCGLSRMLWRRARMAAGKRRRAGPCRGNHRPGAAWLRAAEDRQELPVDAAPGIC